MSTDVTPRKGNEDGEEEEVHDSDSEGTTGDDWVGAKVRKEFVGYGTFDEVVIGSEKLVDITVWKVRYYQILRWGY